MTSFITQEQAKRLADLKATNDALRAEFRQAIAELKVELSGVDSAKRSTLAKRIAEIAQARRDLNPQPEAIQGCDGAGFTALTK